MAVGNAYTLDIFLEQKRDQSCKLDSHPVNVSEPGETRNLPVVHSLCRRTTRLWNSLLKTVVKFKSTRPFLVPCHYKFKFHDCRSRPRVEDSSSYWARLACYMRCMSKTLDKQKAVK